MPDLPAIREALSWHIAAAFARRHPETEVSRSLLPEGVGYDTLVLHTEEVQLALLNRGGRAHVGDEPVEWDRVVELGVHAMVERIEAANGLPFAGKRPRTTPRVLIYRTISRLVNNAAFGTPQHELSGIEVEPCHWDNNWENSRAAWISDFPAVSLRLDHIPCHHHFWHVSGRGMSIALDARSGEAWSRSGRHVDLPTSYSSAGRHFDAYMEGVEELAANRDGQQRDDTSLLAAASWGPNQEGEGTSFTYRASYGGPTWNQGLFEDPAFRLDILALLKHTRHAFSITFAGTGGTPVWICGTRERGRLALETGYGHPGDLQSPKRGGVGELVNLGWKSPVDSALGGFTAVLPDGDAAKAVSLILGTLQSSAYGELHTIWWVSPPSLSAVVVSAQEHRRWPLA